MEYLGKKVYKDGYSKQFKTPKGHRYEIAIEDGETYINCIDEFDKIFQFSKDVLQDNQFMDMLCPEEFPAHKRIGKYFSNDNISYSRQYIQRIQGFRRRIS